MTSKKEREAAISDALAADYSDDDRTESGAPSVNALNRNMPDGMGPVTAEERDAAYDASDERGADETTVNHPPEGPHDPHQTGELDGRPTTDGFDTRGQPDLDDADTSTVVRIKITKAPMNPVHIDVNGIGLVKVPMNEEADVPAVALDALRNAHGIEFEEVDQ